MLPRAYPEQTPTPEALVAAHLDLARRIAWHIHARVGRRVEIEDLLQIAFMGLMDAAQRYVAQPGTPFAAYAGIRIRGTVMDHLRQMAGQTRAVLRMQSQLNATEQRLAQSLLRHPEEAEVAAALDLSTEELARWRAEIDSGRHQSIDDVYTDHSMLFRDDAPSAEERLTKERMKRQLAGAIARLPEREALVLQLYYVEDLNVYEIADVLKVTTGRVSQIKKAAVERLRSLIGADAAA
jgi:RNA polymerase sigma factor FliA